MIRSILAVLLICACTNTGRSVAVAPQEPKAREMTREETDQYVREQGLFGTRIYSGEQPVVVTADMFEQAEPSPE